MDRPRRILLPRADVRREAVCAERRERRPAAFTRPKPRSVPLIRAPFSAARRRACGRSRRWSRIGPSVDSRSWSVARFLDATAAVRFASLRRRVLAGNAHGRYRHPLTIARGAARIRNSTASRGLHVRTMASVRFRHDQARCTPSAERQRRRARAAPAPDDFRVWHRPRS